MLQNARRARFARIGRTRINYLKYSVNGHNGYCSSCGGSHLVLACIVTSGLGHRERCNESSTDGIIQQHDDNFKEIAMIAIIQRLCIAQPAAGGLSLQDLTASSLRVDAALLGLSASSHRVDAALLDLSASSNRVDAALIQLIGYNQNRDRQPEVMCVRGLWVYLEGADGWQVIQELGNFNIYYTSGRNQGTCAAEWDGGVVASDGSGRKHIFLVDSSSTMDVGKVNSCRERFARTIKHTASTVTVGIPAQHATQRLLQQLRRQPSCARLHCYIGGVVIESDAMNRAQTLNYGVIQQHDDKFEVVKFVDR
eukprot:gene30432-39675_t